MKKILKNTGMTIAIPAIVYVFFWSSAACGA